MAHQDCKGFYRALGLAPSASMADIKAAFRKRAMELHPDRNPSRTATREFQILSQAYEVLSDPVARARYDEQKTEDADQRSGQQKSSPSPIACSRCGSVTAQPRFAVFYRVVSFIVITHRTPVQGVYCSACAEKEALKATLITWLLGWWGVPWGLFYSTHALVVNLLGGTRPALVNARIAVHQSYAFACLGQQDVAAGLVKHARRLVARAKPTADDRKKAAMGYEMSDERASLSLILDGVEAGIGNAGPRRQLKDSWRLFRRPFFVQAGLIGMAAVLVLWAVSQVDTTASVRRESPDRPIVYQPPKNFQHEPYVRPAMSPSGEPWPQGPDYVAGFPKLRSRGLSQVTIDNTRSESDVFAKVYSLNQVQNRSVRVVFVPAHTQFIVKTLSPGKYELRYQDLSNGGLARSEPFELAEHDEKGGTHYSDFTMTLYPVQNGNMQTFPLDEKDF